MNAFNYCKRCMPKVFRTKLQQNPPRIHVCNLAGIFRFLCSCVMFVFVFFFCLSIIDLHLGCFFLQALMDDEQAEEFGTQECKAKLP